MTTDRASGASAMISCCWGVVTENDSTPEATAAGTATAIVGAQRGDGDEDSGEQQGDGDDHAARSVPVGQRPGGNVDSQSST